MGAPGQEFGARWRREMEARHQVFWSGFIRGACAAAVFNAVVIWWLA